jgi:hypothetical protein
LFVLGIDFVISIPYYTKVLNLLQENLIFLLKKVITTPPSPIPSNYPYNPVYGGSRGIPASISGYPTPNLVAGFSLAEWFVEEARIQGGYNDTIVDLGVKAYIVEDDTGASIRSSSLIYSGVYNSRTGINNTNQLYPYYF